MHNGNFSLPSVGTDGQAKLVDHTTENTLDFLTSWLLEQIGLGFRPSSQNWHLQNFMLLKTAQVLSNKLIRNILDPSLLERERAY
jgi:hypothetical protein